MKPPKFDYFAPDSIESALALLTEHGEDARYLGGGQSLVPMMNLRVAALSALIDLAISKEMPADDADVEDTDQQDSQLQDSQLQDIDQQDLEADSEEA